MAEANALLIEAASLDAEQQFRSLTEAVATMQQEPEKSREALSIARLSISFARQAYQQAEPAIFYVDPASNDEAVALPDPFKAGTPQSQADRLGKIAGSLDDLEWLLKNDPRKHLQKIVSLWFDMSRHSASLPEEMAGLSTSWDDEQPASFRQRFFITSPRDSIARIFQGVLAVTGDLLPNYWLREGQGWSDSQPPLIEVAGRLRAVRNIYAGRFAPYGSAKEPALIDLVREKSPLQAQATLATLESGLLIAEQLALNAGDTAQARNILLRQADQATSDLISAAGSLGIEIIEVPAYSPSGPFSP